MAQKADHFIVRIRNRPWYVWMLRFVWILWLLFWLEFAIGSKQEVEQQAFSIAVKVLIVSVFLGLGLYFWKLRDPGKEPETPSSGEEMGGRREGLRGA